MLVIGLLSAQSGLAQRNIVPNGSFEEYSNLPLGWFYKGAHFSRVIKYWHSPSAASPDVFGPKVRVPRQWAEKGFGDLTARSGTSMVGITVYGCKDGKPHCREYLQIQLAEPLVVGQRYRISAYLAPLLRSIRCNEIGFAFSTTPIKEITDQLIEKNTVVKAKSIIAPNLQAWENHSGEFTADEAAEFLIIGNFSDDETTNISTKEGDLNFGYYYVDDVILKKLKPFINVPIQENDLSQIALEAGKIVLLKDIFFDHDKVELLPRSFIELNKLKQLFLDNPNLQIEIRGHTDNVGEDLYNLSLSQRRAKAVAEYLFKQGIDRNRIRYVGFGSEQPVAENTTPTGRQNNRRVEFMILSK